MARKRGSTPQRSTARKRRGRTVQPPEPQARRSGTQPSPGPAGPPVEPRFPVVGLGTSAGGLHVLQRFFSAIPETPGIAFVVVQHLDPTHKSETAELLRRHCKIPVAEVHDGEPVVPDRVYVIPPDRDLTIEKGVLRLREPGERRGLRMPIDLFLRTLAEDQQERAIAIILSGNGSDGSQGLRAVKAAGGLTMAQDPTTAEYDGMPRSAVATRMVDFALAVEKLPAVLLRYASGRYVRRRDDSRFLTEEAAEQLQSILALLRARTRHDFTWYKKGTITRRIERRMSLHHLDSAEEYSRFLQAHPTEVKELFNDLLISVTSFFREPKAWEYLDEHVLTPLIRGRSDGASVRAWVPGCATGEEAYSLAMLLTARVQTSDRSLGVQVFGSDLDQRALDYARAGIYPEGIAADVPPERLRRFFVKGENHYQVSKQVRETVVFAAQNLIGDPPFSRLDLITCRNLLIYLAPEIQRKVVALFHFALQPGGYLFLGSAESVGPDIDLFEPVSKKWRIYRRIGTAGHEHVPLPLAPKFTSTHVAADTAAAASPKDNLLKVVQAAVLHRYVPAAAVVNGKQEILYLFGPTDRFLVQPTGTLSSDLLAWAPKGTRAKLSAALRQAVLERKRTVTTTMMLDGDRDPRHARITVEPLGGPKETEGLFLVVFADEPPVPGVAGATLTAAHEDAVVQQMEYELTVLREQLRSSAEQFESSNEELKSANEEMMSMNEELQSTNEELETSKEELQSLNEELSTVNGQLESKIQEVESTNDDLKNLLSSASIATIFLDREFRIRRFTPAMTRLLSLLPSDIRRPISDFAQKFTDRRLLPDAEQVLTTLAPVEAEVRTEDGRWYLRRILPYRTEQDRIEGVVVTFTDLTERRKTEQARAELAAIVESSDVAIISKTLGGTITSWNRGAQEMYGYAAKEAVGRSIEILVPTDHRRELKEILRRVAAGESVHQLETVRQTKAGVRLDVLLTVSPLYSPETGGLVGASAIGRDISERKRAENEIRQAKEALEAQVADRTRQLTDANQKLQGEINERRRSEQARQHLLERLVTIQADERRRISRELHDQIGQHVAALALRLKALQPGVTDQAGFKSCQGMLDQLGRQLRDLAIAVRPAGLEELGLVPALSSYAEEWAAHHRIKLDFHQRGLQRGRLSPAIEDAAYRIALEALTNISKHAGAKRASLLLERRDHALHVIVEDDGTGFDVEAFRLAGPGDHLGMVGMEERAELLDGKFTIESRPGGGGTTLFVRIPLPGGTGA